MPDRHDPPAMAGFCLLTLAWTVAVCGGCGGKSAPSGGKSEQDVRARVEAAKLNDQEEGTSASPKPGAIAAAPAQGGAKPPAERMKAAAAAAPSEDDEARRRMDAARLNDLEERGLLPRPKSPAMADASRRTLPASRAETRPPRNVDAESVASSPSPATAPSARPKDVADWKRDDYYSAKRDDDPRLAEAVALLGKRFIGKETAAELLTRLLESGADDPFAQPSAQPATSKNLKTTEAIVAALAANGTPLAGRTLERLAIGALETVDKQVAAAAALKGLAARQGQAGEDILFRVVIAPQPGDPARRIAGNAVALRATALELVKSLASESLRLRLARHAAEAETPQATCDELWECLKEPRTENVAAQIVFYRSNRLNDKARACLEEQLARQSTAALRGLLGLAQRKERQAGAEAAPMAIDADRAAELLWDADFAAAVAARLRTVEGLAQGQRLLRLAAVVPSQPLRIAMLQTLSRHWEEGPRALEPLSAPDGLLQEPGLLLVVKKLLRKELPPASRSAKKASNAASSRDARQRQDGIAQQWMTYSENLIRVTCQRFREASLTADPAGKSADAVAGDLPFKPSPNAEITASYRADWPEGLAGTRAAKVVSPLRIRYLRFEQKTRPVRLLAYYRGQLSNCVEGGNRFGLWLDALMTDRERGAVRSVDVLITRRAKDIPIVPNEEQQLTVEILLVEVENADRAGRDVASSRGT
jgi:hypothetical protein